MPDPVSPVLTDVMEYDEAHYFGVVDSSVTPATTTITLGGVITSLTESSNPKETTKQYIHEKASRTNVTGFDNEFPITMDMVAGDEVFEDFYGIFYNRSTGADAKRDHYIVNLWQPTETANVYKARKITQTVSITEANGEAGEQKQITGSLKGGNFVYGTFNTSTKAFTEDA